MEDTRFGIILLETKFVGKEDIDRCLQLQFLGGQAKPLGQIMLEEGLIHENVLKLVLDVQERRRERLEEERILGETQEGRLPTLKELLHRSHVLGVTDLILGSGRPPFVRMGGRLSKLFALPLDQEWMTEFLQTVLSEEEAELFETQGFVPCSLELGSRFWARIRILHDSNGVSAVLRLYPSEILTLTDLGHGKWHLDQLEKSGLFLISGGASSGKTTTLASMVHYLSKQAGLHIQVLTSNGEFRLQGERSLVTTKQFEEGGQGLAKALRAALRSDADIIVLDELKGSEAVEFAVQAAEMGKLVIAAVRGGGTVKTLKALVHSFSPAGRAPARKSLASTLLGVIHQELVPSRDHKGLILTREELRIEVEAREALEKGNFEDLVLLLNLGDQEHGKSLDENLMDLVEEDRIDVDEAISRAMDCHRMLKAVR
jgi:twitching motility protein PilT